MAPFPKNMGETAQLRNLIVLGYQARPGWNGLGQAVGSLNLALNEAVGK